MLRKMREETEFSAKLFSKGILFSSYSSLILFPPTTYTHTPTDDFPFRATFLPIHSWFPEQVLPKSSYACI